LGKINLKYYYKLRWKDDAIIKKLNEIFKEFNLHLMEDKMPSLYFNFSIKNEIYDYVYPLTMLRDLISTPQSPKYHSEGSVWNHTMLVIDEAAKRKNLSNDVKVFMWAALLHDLGKAPATKLKNGRITSYDHDIKGEKLCIEFLSEFNCEKQFVKDVSLLVRWHMQTLFTSKKLPFGNLKQMMREVDYREIALLSLCDRLGRGDMTSEKIREEEHKIEEFINKCELCDNNLYVTK
jgi:putative nucleotidyltransferase with HDIG domain